MTPRLLTISDLPQALGLSSSAGWNQTTSDWLRLLKLAPESCFGIESDGSLVATATLLPYGRRLAWVGMVLTRRDYQHRGLARQLLAHALAAAGELGIETVKLDATDQGQPLYEKLGFVAERRIERWSWNGRCDVAAQPGVSVPLESLAGLDSEAFGANRTQLLDLLAAAGACAPLLTAEGYALWTPGQIANHIGPCVARTPEVARDLIARCLAQAAASPALQNAPQALQNAPQALEKWMWDLFPDNAPALELASRFGFQPVRRLTRMRLGPPIAERPGLVYAAAGFELG
jgi:GNAT superfamily N-acetyltransferase